jgi:tight adherence protein C
LSVEKHNEVGVIPATVYISIGTLGVVLCVGYVVLQYADRYRSAVDARLRGLAWGGASPLDGNQGALGSESKKRPVHWRTTLNRLVPANDGDRRRHQVRMVMAGMYGPTALSTFFGAKLALMLVPTPIGLLASQFDLVTPLAGLLYGCIAGLFGMVVPSLWLDYRIRNRHRVLRRSLPDMLDVMTVCLEGGLSIQSTIQRVADELQFVHPALAKELRIVQREMELGVSIDAALRHLADRTGYEGVRPLAAFIREAQRHGSDLAEALRIHADMLRSQRESEAEEAAQRAAVKILIPTLLLILPAVFVVLAGPAAIRVQEAFSK